MRRKDVLRSDGVPSLLKQYIITNGLDTSGHPASAAVCANDDTSDSDTTRVRRSRRVRNKPEYCEQTDDR